MYITTGDAADPDIAQDLDSLGGKILRMYLDGTVPDDNPLDASYVYSYRHRNPQGLTWTPSGMDNHDGRLYVAALCGTAVFEFNLEDSTEAPFVTDFGRVRDVRIEEDMMYIITNNIDGRGNAASDDDKLYSISLEE